MNLIYRPKGRALEYAFLAVNHYKGCRHGCEYCYVPDVTHNQEFFKKQSIKENIIDSLRSDAAKISGTSVRVLLCFSCDPYQPLDEATKLTRHVIKILREFDIPFQVLTKGGKRAVRDFDLYGPYDAFGTTLTFLNDNDSTKHEPHAALPGQRIAAIIAAKQTGIETWVSLEPVIDEKQTLEIIRQTHEYVDLFRVGRLNHRDSAINWKRFGAKAIELCRNFRTDYYIKKDLAACLDGIAFSNTDKRKVNRRQQTKNTLF